MLATHPNYGKHLSQETRDKIRTTMLGRTYSEERRLHISLGHWKTGEHVREGWMMIRCYGHHPVEVHRSHLVWGLNSGMTVQPWEVIHHIDGNKLNDEPENLQLMTRAEHCALHRSCQEK